VKVGGLGELPQEDMPRESAPRATEASATRGRTALLGRSDCADGRQKLFRQPPIHQRLGRHPSNARRGFELLVQIGIDRDPVPTSCIDLELNLANTRGVAKAV
jgi:hypothetical protein